MDIRKTVFVKEVTEQDGVGQACDPITRVVAMCVLRNPFAGRFVEDLSPLFDLSGAIGDRLMEDAVAMLAGPPVSYGKAAIVGVDGDLEHGGAVLHPKLGRPMRAAVGRGQGADPVERQGRGGWCADRFAARPQGRPVVIRSLRHPHGLRAGQPAPRRDHAGDRLCRRRTRQPEMRPSADHDMTPDMTGREASTT